MTQNTYDPFGDTIISGEISDNPFQYTGRENDGTGLYYYRARYYSPELQRFISEDPIGFAGGDVNFYAYVGNNPINLIDPSGLNTIAIGAGIGSIFGPGGTIIGGAIGLGFGIIMGDWLWDTFVTPEECDEDTWDCKYFDEGDTPVVVPGALMKECFYECTSNKGNFKVLTIYVPMYSNCPRRITR